MNLKQFIAVAILTAGAIYALPGVTFAEPNVNANTNCDGTFAISADYSDGSTTHREYVWIDGKSWDDSFGNGSTPPTGMHVQSDNSHYVADPNIADYYRFDQSANGFFVLDGTYEAVQDNGGDVTVEVFQTDDADYVGTFKSGADVNGYDSETVTFGPDADQNPNNDWEKCVVTYCLDGNPEGGTDYSFRAAPSDDCQQVAVKLIEFTPDATNDQFPHLGGTPVAHVVQEVSAVESSQATQEVIALPSAGYGVGESSSPWAMVLGLTLIVASCGTVLIARRR